jgi:hypothetical protein
MSPWRGRGSGDGGLRDEAALLVFLEKSFLLGIPDGGPEERGRPNGRLNGRFSEFRRCGFFLKRRRVFQVRFWPPRPTSKADATSA